ncbi:cysteine desulfurase [Agrilactobacillus composti DSM 18527 = JCM 14202]|uniref:Cysteine desulfurase n=1 Tax=Agrilactobacillus composti DSM 18527 = JCM 14202 TaxID=1423734 RepID=X0PN98_9LACO|nr:cysteine desulfurase family protein [Agrilactobacillus composti]KRM36632.1 cysteine desulfurase [Agrilactobacillus composti DSM 18527 = JCM 14202]GAF39032.1 cysteine desulfurase [Agrilactobacillus composti DSM 18527 = JCM 14202]
MKHIYLDNAATTPMAPAVVQVMTDTMTQTFGNASSPHYFGRAARSILDESRHTIAQSIHAQHDDEIVFTSGGSESDNTAIIQTALAKQAQGKHIITTAVEHPAVLKSLAYLETLGFEVTYLPVDANNHIDIADFEAALRPDTILVTIMMGNNETGARMPIHEIGAILKDHPAIFHTDAVQAYGLLPIDVTADHIDLLSTSAHKINGPKFIGFLYVREGINYLPLIKGGEQEHKRRAGTENIPAIAGFAKAVSLISDDERSRRQTKYASFKQSIVTYLADHGVAFEVNGTLATTELQHVFNIWFKGIPTNLLQMNLDLAGYAVSGGSACTAGSLEPSHVLTAMFGADSPRISESIRISFGAQTTQADIDGFNEALVGIVEKYLARQTVK